MDDSQPKAKYLVLNHAISASLIDRLLGCVVNDVTDPSDGFQPDFAPSEEDGTSSNTNQGGLSDYTKLRNTMNRYMMENQGNQVNLRDLLTEKIMEGDLSVEGSLTKLLKAHYGSKDRRNFEIEAATGKRYHLHNAIYKFKNDLWTNKYYRDRIHEVIDQKREDGTIEYLNRDHRKYGIKKTHHKCEVVVLPMIVGILTCKEIKVNVVDNKERQAGAEVTVPVGELAGLQTNGMLDVGANMQSSKMNEGRTAETIPDEVIVAIAYDLIAISTGNTDTTDSLNGLRAPDSKGLFSRIFSRGQSSKPCPACEEYKQKNKVDYPAAWRHAPIRTHSSRGMNVVMAPSPSSGSIHSDSETQDDDPYNEHAPDLADAPPELYVKQPEHYVLAEDLYPGVSPSSTGSTVRSKASRSSGKRFVVSLPDRTRRTSGSGSESEKGSV